MKAFITFHFLREDISEKRKSIHEIANSLSIKPDRIEEKGIKPKSGPLPKQDCLSFYYNPKGAVQLEYIEDEINVLLEKVSSLKPEIDEKLGNCFTILSIAFYSKGQANPGIAINRKALNLLNILGAEIDIDTYFTG